MIRYGCGKKRTNPDLTKRGFTLIELLIAMMLGAAIMSVMVAAITIILRTTSQNEDWNVSLRQVHNAGHWITQDALMAQEVHTDTPGVFLELKWNDWNNDQSVKYYINGNTLRRSLNDATPILIAQNIVTDNTSCDWYPDEQKLIVNISSSVHSGRTASQKYEISPRPMNRGG